MGVIREMVEENTDEILIMEGIISSSVYSKTSNGSHMYNIKLNNDSSEEFATFSSIKYDYLFAIGDWIKFTYIVKGIYRNIKDIIGYKRLSVKGVPNELNMVIDRLDCHDPKIVAIELAFRYGILKNYEIDEIYALYHRILNTINETECNMVNIETEEDDKIKRGFWNENSNA